MPKKTMTYQYVSDYAVITFDVELDVDGEDEGFDEDRFDDASMFDLGCYATNPKDYWLDDCWEKGTK